MTQWREMYAAVEQTYCDAALLLQDADGLLQERGLHVAPGKKNTVGAQGGLSISRPSFWFTGWVSRHYGRPDAPSKEARWYVAVLFCSRKYDDIDPLDEPVITAGVLSNPGWEYTVAKAWAWNAKRVADGTVSEKKVKYGFVNSTVRSFARPISAVRSTDALRTLIIEPLLKLESP